MEGGNLGEEAEEEDEAGLEEEEETSVEEGDDNDDGEHDGAKSVAGEVWFFVCVGDRCSDDADGCPGT